MDFTYHDLVDLEASLYRKRVYDHLDLNPKQKTALKLLSDRETEFLLFGGGANGGKSWLGCTWILENALSYPGSRWFIGREELKRLRDTTLMTFYKVARWLDVPRELYDYNGQDHFIEFRNGSRVDLLDLKFLPRDPLYERYGGLEVTGGWIEEGGEVDFGAFDTLKTRVGRHMNDAHGLMGKMLITCNPKKNWLYRVFYKPWKDASLSPEYRFIQSLVGDNPKRESGSLEKLQGISDRVKRERLLLGNWEYEDDPSALMDYSAISDLFTNEHVQPNLDFRAMTVDVARMGSDLTVIRIWHGWVVIATYVFEKKKTDFTSGQIIALAAQHGVPRSRIVIDEDGVGGGVVDQVHGSIGFVNNSSPIIVEGKAENYQNLKSQCYFRYAERVNKRETAIRVTSEGERDRTVEELEQVKRKNPDGDGKLAVIPKDDMKAALGHSPDFADSLMMREYLELCSTGSRAVRNPWGRAA